MTDITNRRYSIQGLRDFELYAVEEIVKKSLALFDEFNKLPKQEAQSPPKPIEEDQHTIIFWKLMNLQRDLDQVFTKKHPELSTYAIKPLEKTLVILKPDAIKKRLSDVIVSRLEGRGLHVVDTRMTSRASTQIMKKHYVEHEGKSFYDELISFMVSGPICIMSMRGPDAIRVAREELSSIRNDYRDPHAPARENLIHASDSKESAKREITVWFGEDDEDDMTRR